MMGQPRVALATAARLPKGTDDTAGLSDALFERGAVADLVVWNDPSVHWRDYFAVMPHCPWDYANQVDEFTAWIDQLSDGKGLLPNSSEIIRWNMDKRYLLELACRGVVIPETLAVSSGSEVDQRLLIDRFGEGPLVVKAVVGAGGRQVWLCENAEKVVEISREKLGQSPALIQQFEPSIQTTGEFSAVYFNGELSHVVLKTAAPGEFRIQSHYGGTTTAVEHEPWMRGYGASIIAMLPMRPAYARVDFVVPQPASPKLMEVELIEPDLFLRDGPRAFQTFAEVLYRHAESSDECRPQGHD